MIRFNAFLVIMLVFNGIAFSSSGEVGSVGNINYTTKEIVVNINSGTSLQMGELLEIDTGKGKIILEVKFPMMTVAKCIIKNKGKISGLTRGMLVYKYGMSTLKEEKEPVAEKKKISPLPEDKKEYKPVLLNSNNAGCGLGTMLFRGKKGKVFELFAVTTNYSLVNSTFAVTSGTSGYQEGLRIGVNIVDVYVAQNMDNLASDIARGDGEYLNTLATLMKVDDRYQFKKKLKRNFRKIYSSKDVTSKEVVANIKNIYNS